MKQFKWIGAILAVAMVVVLVSPVFAIEARGRIKSIDNDKNEMTMTTSDNKTLTFRFKEDVKVKLNDGNKKLSDLKAGDEVTVTYERVGENLNVSQIVARRGQNIEATGTVKSIDTAKKEFSMSTDDNKTLKFRFNDDVKVQLNDKTGKLSDMKVGDMVRVQYSRDGDDLRVSEISVRRKD